ncbi:META domain-containing protein [Novosphingobium flavum]|uniref:META domain-containing protein n=1 Tax=Novosphingobium flavum TaxID=1778672 RepID=A0A7X1FNX7_9SPHN|nr:META domain-containing protein [Novosphingobium flavum]MBC2664280.1 META domain-containing protein [Novosphingobium flavum]
MVRRALLFLLPALAASGCVAGPKGERGPQLTGTNWAFAEIDGAEPVSALAALRFENDRLGANVGCNGMGGPWHLDKGHLIAGPLISTQMWCEGKMEQERAVSALLSSAPEVSLKGNRLTLKTGGHSAQLVRK